MNTLYMVYRRPSRYNREAFLPIYWFTHARSKTEAVRKAKELLPSHFGTNRYRYSYLAPRAELVVPGGPIRTL